MNIDGPVREVKLGLMTATQVLGPGWVGNGWEVPRQKGPASGYNERSQMDEMVLCFPKRLAVVEQCIEEKRPGAASQVLLAVESFEVMETKEWWVPFE